MRKIFLLCILSMSFCVNAADLGGNRYIFFSGSYGTYWMDSYEAQAPKFMSSMGYTFGGGYKISMIGPEGFMKFGTGKGTFRDANNYRVNFTLEHYTFGAGARFMWLFASAKAGLVYHWYDNSALRNNRITNFPVDFGRYGVYMGIGGRFPLHIMDLYADLTYTAMGASDLFDAEAGFRIRF